MDIKTALDGAIQSDLLDLQALILFLVMEKQVLRLEYDIKELDLYFKENNQARMNQELLSFKNKMKMNYKPNVYKVKTTNNMMYIYARDIYECNRLASELSNGILDITVNVDEKMTLNGSIETIKNMTRNRETPILLGGNRMEHLYKEQV